jgi:CubicO group peptidase (beta-lactamase class C family)
MFSNLFKALTTLFVCLLTGGVLAQTNSKALIDSLTAFYNRGDYPAFYNMGSDTWKKGHDTAGIRGWLSWMHGQTGEIAQATYNRPEGDYQLIRWDGKLKTTGFILQQAEDGKFADFGFNTYKEPVPAEQLQAIPTDNPLKTALDSTVQRVAGAFKVYNKPTGLSIGIVFKGKTYIYNYGSISKSKQQLPTGSTLYETGSIIKTFTGLLLAKAVTGHKVALEDDVRKYLSAGYDNLQYNGHPLRLIDLADYTSGLPPVQILRSFDESTPQAAAAFFKEYSIADFLEDVQHVKPDTTPGTRYSYSTAGFNLLAYILSRVYNKPFAELTRENILRPIGMKETSLYLKPAARALFPQGYNASGDVQPDIYGPLDSLDLLHSTVSDMLRYLQYQVSEADTAVRLSHRQFSDAPHNEAGLGWFIYDTPAGRAFGKGGNSVHMSCRSWVIPSKQVAIMVFANNNQQDWGNLVEDITDYLTKQ